MPTLGTAEGLQNGLSINVESYPIAEKVKRYMAGAKYLSYVWKLQYKIANMALNVTGHMGMSRKQNVIDRNDRNDNPKP